MEAQNGKLEIPGCAKEPVKAWHERKKLMQYGRVCMRGIRRPHEMGHGRYAVCKPVIEHVGGCVY